MKILLRALAALMLVSLSLALPATWAAAGTAASRVGGYSTTLLYTAGAGDINDVRITGSGGTYTVHDSAGATAGADCAQVDAVTATCTTYFDYASIHLKGGNDASTRRPTSQRGSTVARAMTGCTTARRTTS
jgi:hypothetical protein